MKRRGPLRLIVGYRPHPYSEAYLIEMLECGHERTTTLEPEIFEFGDGKDPVRRHCKDCLGDPAVDNPGLRR